MPKQAPPPITIRRRLLGWYDKHQRRLPWRAHSGQPANPYHVLVSEAMLQQTQVATVIDYFHRFMAELPTLEALANAKEQQVLRLWQGLGYYRRARNLHAAARLILQEHSGRVPDTVEDLLKLPGVGRYTAGAIASIAHGVPAPILDGNVIRVLSRLYVIDQPVGDTATTKAMWQLAEQLVPRKRPGDFNQAMMELGALVCTKAKPTCDQCPLVKMCGAHQEGRVDELPISAKRQTAKVVHHHVIALSRRGRFLFQQRPAEGLWSNMWQLPTLEDATAKFNGHRLEAWVKDQLGLTLDAPTELGTFKHQTTHRTIHFHLWLSVGVTGRLRRGAGEWRTLSQLDDLPLPNPQRHAVKLLLK